jgi:NTP pyrophosphatase (non-canonical NTP hydrolase)
MPTEPFPTFHDYQKAVVAFRDARDWKQFHSPRQLAAALMIEAGELQQAMLWKTDAEVKAGLADGTLTPAIGDEIADVLSFALILAHDLGLDPAELIATKLKKNEQRYPIDKSRGRSTKYDKF